MEHRTVSRKPGQPFAQTFTDAQREIADATIRVIAEQGFDVVSVRTVAKASGFSAGSVQYHFGTRQEILIAALVRTVQRCGDRADEHPSLPSQLDSMTLKLSEVLPIGPVQREDLAAWIAYSAASSTRDWLAPLHTEAVEIARRRVELSLQRAERNGTLAPGLDPVCGSRLISAMVNGLTVEFLNTEPSPSEMRTLLRTGLSRFILEED
ncbi:TetR/AcrR family transcriptional regulator [Helcobacillus massiliensis]|uniref:TetR/AcrR family transcriptional regulator n=1 Tax=Helcobacillus massiliensis TaxID=521392 RepID=UPI0021A8DD26|nr:TetR/AcrR family transcriptional regulator [Helcobacillus massiliensis]MCT1558428.1 TetR/AcrR family transcriptional regulator [Helcobacillus massiliensis]MCT2037024.1 TetR/AcrR family transcriptional regulator [Helcobacillus massiliensis]MCT2332717.1 TetR/AcrR family transcriptional regulator [Helcobacillus massiliensis]